MNVEQVLAGYLIEVSAEELTDYTALVEAHLVEVAAVAETRDFESTQTEDLR